MPNNEENFEVLEESAAGDGLNPVEIRKIQHAQVLPLHHATGANQIRKNSLGRPKSVKVQGQSVVRPTVDQLRYNAEMNEAEVRFVALDPIVQAARANVPPKDMFRLLVIQAAQNAAALEFQRIELQKRGEETSNIIGRHTKVLKEVASLQAELKEVGEQMLDPRSDGFQKVFKLWVEKIQATISEVLSPEQADLFFTKFAGSMENWEEQAEAALR